MSEVKERLLMVCPLYGFDYEKCPRVECPENSHGECLHDLPLELWNKDEVNKLLANPVSRYYEKVIKIPEIHSFTHEVGGGTCTCGTGPYCSCGFCVNCGRTEFSITMKFHQYYLKAYRQGWRHSLSCVIHWLNKWFSDSDALELLKVIDQEIEDICDDCDERMGEPMRDESRE